MSEFKVGDVVARKSYGGDVYFRVTDVIRQEGGKPVCILRGLMYRLAADADPGDLVKQDAARVISETRQHLAGVQRHAFREEDRFMRTLFSRLRTKPGRVLHVDSSGDFMEKCLSYYRRAGVSAAGKVMDENRQPQAVSRLLETYSPDILVITGHDGIRKGAQNLNSPDSYRNSKYFIEAVKEARKYQKSPDKLCIFAGACQSYFEAIMAAGANFASSPGRILINALDPAIVSRKVALTDKRKTITPGEIAQLTISGSKGVGGVTTRGQMQVW